MPLGKRNRRNNRPKRRCTIRRGRFFQERAAPSADAARFLRGGALTGITGTGADYASGFPGNGMDFVRAVLVDVSRLKRRLFSPAEISGLYCRRTASKILEDGFVAVQKNEPGVRHIRAIRGCVDYNLVICAVLRAKGIPAKFIREGEHSLTHFYLNGSWFEADPMTVVAHRRPTGPVFGPSITRVTGARLEGIKKARELGAWGEGLDAHDIGIYSILDFKRFNPLRKHGAT